jgi:nucleoside-diphosphate-sugar epimerase
MAQVLVTGGAGFIGRHVVRRLLQHGYAVRVLDDFSNSGREGMPEDAKLDVREGDVADVACVAAAMEGVDHVVHLAALVSVPLSVQQPNKTFASNVVGTQVVMEAARVEGIKGCVMYASSAAVYGAREAEGGTREDEALTAHLVSPYAVSKAMDETLGRMYRDVYGIKTLGLRFFNVYGEGQNPSSPYSGVLSRIVHMLGRGETFTVFGDGEQTRDFVAVQDIAAVIVRLLEQGAEVPPVMNLGSGQRVRLLDVIDAVAQVMGVTPTVVHGPAQAGDVRSSCADINLLRATLPQWSPTLLADGLRQWLKAE